VEFVCELQYYGAIQPKVQWYLGHSGDPFVEGLVHSTSGKLEARLLVSADSSSWPTECRISFPRQSCSQPRPAYTRTLSCQQQDSNYMLEIFLYFTIPSIDMCVQAVISRLLGTCWWTVLLYTQHCSVRMRYHYCSWMFAIIDRYSFSKVVNFPRFHSFPFKFFPFFSYKHCPQNPAGGSVYWPRPYHLGACIGLHRSSDFHVH